MTTRAICLCRAIDRGPHALPVESAIAALATLHMLQHLTAGNVSCSDQIAASRAADMQLSKQHRTFTAGLGRMFLVLGGGSSVTGIFSSVLTAVHSCLSCLSQIREVDRRDRRDLLKGRPPAEISPASTVLCV